MKAKTMLKKLRKTMTQTEVAELLANTTVTIGKNKTKLGKLRCITKHKISDWESGYRNPSELIRMALEFHA